MFLLCYVLCIFFIKITYTFLRLVFKISSLFVLFSDPDKVLIVVSSPEGIVSILFQLISDFYRTSPLLSAVIAMIVTVCPSRLSVCGTILTKKTYDDTVFTKL